MAYVDLITALILAMIAVGGVEAMIAGHTSCGVDLPRAEAVSGALVFVGLFWAAARLLVRTWQSDEW